MVKSGSMVKSELTLLSSHGEGLFLRDGQSELVEGVMGVM